MSKKRKNQFDDIIIGAASYYVNTLNKNKKRPSIWVNRYLQERGSKGRFNADFEDLVQNDLQFRENFHMSSRTFHELFQILELRLLPKKATRLTDAISPKQKLAIVLEYLASGSLQRHIASVYRISKQHFGAIIDQVCNAISIELKEEIPAPTKESMVEVANGFNCKWNFPNCTGALDGRHVPIKAPPNSGSIFYNYKGFHSLVLMAASDANYKFTYIDIGGYGSEGDANIFANCELGQAIIHDKLPFPGDINVGYAKLPFFFVGDDAFPLHKRIMKPFVPKRPHMLTDEEKIFNYRLSRARRCVENCFGILCAKWQCLARSMYCTPDRAQKIITACCYLHNFLMRNNSESYCPIGFVDRFDAAGNVIEGDWRKNMTPGNIMSTHLPSYTGRHNNIGKQVQQELKNYVNSAAGSLSWQRRAAFVF